MRISTFNVLLANDVAIFCGKLNNNNLFLSTYDHKMAILKSQTAHLNSFNKYILKYLRKIKMFL